MADYRRPYPYSGDFEGEFRRRGAEEGVVERVSRHYQWVPGSERSNPYNQYHSVHDPSQDVTIPVWALFLDGEVVMEADPNCGVRNVTAAGEEVLADWIDEWIAAKEQSSATRVAEAGNALAKAGWVD